MVKTMVKPLKPTRFLHESSLRLHLEAIILRPHGFLGAAMVAIVRFVQSHAAAPWPVRSAWRPQRGRGEELLRS